MQYRKVPKNGDQLSALGFGAMRLPMQKGRIDEERARNQIRLAIDKGVNYIDTAFLYHGGESEVFLGRVLQGGYREKVKLATKLPPSEIKKREDMNNIFDIQLRKLQTDYIDYYLLHGLDAISWKKLRNFGILEFLEEIKTAQKIKNAGFSFHGDVQTFKKIIDSYNWDFCQIQYNFLDEDIQAGTEGLHYASSKNIAVMVMEPLRGGMLASRLPKEVKKIYEKANKHWSAAEWGLRWVWNHPEVTVVLSGMNHENQVIENIKTCENALPGSMTLIELEIIGEVAKCYKRLIKVKCNECGYCMPCPYGVNIPQCFSFYNLYFTTDRKLKTRVLYGLNLMGGLIESSDASLCKNCGKCMKTCPQQIAIPDELKKVSKQLGGLPTKIPFLCVKLIRSLWN
jgi:predicted aldo/keto reductase-like oxidoreductase